MLKMVKICMHKPHATVCMQEKKIVCRAFDTSFKIESRLLLSRTHKMYLSLFLSLICMHAWDLIRD